jgi:hypothetical protein
VFISSSGLPQIFSGQHKKGPEKQKPTGIPTGLGWLGYGAGEGI